MKKVVFNKQLISFFAACLTCFLSGNLTAADAPGAASLKESDCSKDLLLAYFPEVFVKETFTKFNISKEKWDAIIKSLNEKDKDVIKMVEEKASKMNPNPLKDPQQRQAAVKLFRETLLEIFSSVLKANDIQDDGKIASMLDDIQQQKAKRFAMCIKRDNASLDNANLDDDDEDDDDDDEDEDEDEDDDLDAPEDKAKKI